MPPAHDRGEVWIVDLGMAAKVRPCLLLSVPTAPQDHVLVTVVPHTTTLHGTRIEVAIPVPFLQPGAFNIQGIATVAQVKLVRYLGELQPDELALVETAVRVWLGL